MYYLIDQQSNNSLIINKHNINKNKIKVSVTEISKLNTSFFPKW